MGDGDENLGSVEVRGKLPPVPMHLRVRAAHLLLKDIAADIALYASHIADDEVSDYEDFEASDLTNSIEDFSQAIRFFVAEKRRLDAAEKAHLDASPN